MPRNQSNNKKPRKQRQRNTPRPQPSVGRSIARGVSALANTFIPGSGGIVSGIGRLLGFGAYTSEQAEGLLASRVPSMHATLDRGVRIAHHEFLGDVSSSVAYSSQTYPLNPGMQATFPWLCTVASAFQEYEINGCVFYFKSTSASALNSTNTALGQIVGAFQYNPYLAAPASKIAILGLSGSTDGKPSESNLFPVECKADMVLMRSKLIRTGGVADDLAKYDHGNFFLAAVGSQAAATVGELHVVYDVTLKKPRLSSSAAGQYARLNSTDSVTLLYPLGATRNISCDNMGLVTTTTTIQLPGNMVFASTMYKLTIIWSAVTAATITCPALTVAGASYVNRFFGTTVSSLSSPPNGVSSQTLILTAMVTATSTGTPITFTLGTGGVIPTSGTAVDIQFEQVTVS